MKKVDVKETIKSGGSPKKGVKSTVVAAKASIPTRTKTTRGNNDKVVTEKPMLARKGENPIIPGTVIVPKNELAIPIAEEQTLGLADQLNLNNLGNDKASVQYFNNPFEPSSGSAEMPGNAAYGGMYNYGRCWQARARLQVCNRESFRVTAFAFWGPQNTSLTTGNVAMSAAKRNWQGRVCELSGTGGIDKGQMRWGWMDLHTITGTALSDYTNSATFAVNGNVPPVIPALVSFWICIDSNGPVLVNGVDYDIEIEFRVVYFSRITSVLTYRDDFGDLVTLDPGTNQPSVDRPGLKPDKTLAKAGLGKCRIRLDPGEFAVQMPNSFVRRFRYKDEDAFFDAKLVFVRDLAPFPYALWQPEIRALVCDMDLRRLDIELSYDPFFGFCGYGWDKIARLKLRMELERQRKLFMTLVTNNNAVLPTSKDSELERQVLCLESFLGMILVNGSPVTKTTT